MKLEEVILETPKTKQDTDRLRPRVIAWKGVKMVRVHSLRASVREIIEFSKSIDLVRIGLIGNQGTGKSTLAQTLGHLIHTMSEKDHYVPFAVRIFSKEQLLDFEQTLKTLTPANYVLVFDDVSFLGAKASKKQIEYVKQAVTEIRHLQGGQDVKIILILNYHYTLGLDKYLRQADFRYFTSVGSSEIDNMEKVVGSKNMWRIRAFMKIYTKAIVKKYFTVRIGGKEVFQYKYRAPFIPSLFYNNDTLRLVVSPTRHWIDQICGTCAEASGQKISDVSVDQFIKEAEKKFPKGIVKVAAKLHLFMNGMNTFSNPVVTAQRYISRAETMKVITGEEIAAHYGLDITKARLRKQLDGVLVS